GPDSSLSRANVVGRSGHAWTIFDPTDESLPLGSISSEIGGGLAVIADSAEGLVRLPEPTRSTFEYEVRGRLTDEGTILGQLTVWISGPARDEFMARFGPITQAERRYRAATYLASRWPEAVLDTCRLAVAAAAAQRTGVVFEFRLPGAAYGAGSAW